jgi:hypothetical protein
MDDADRTVWSIICHFSRGTGGIVHTNKRRFRHKTHPSAGFPLYTRMAEKLLCGTDILQLGKERNRSRTRTSWLNLRRGGLIIPIKSTSSGALLCTKYGVDTADFAREPT